MPNAVLLMKLTDQGVKDIKEAPKRIEAGIKGFENMGGKVLGFYVTLGEYDYVAVGEAPSEAVMLAFAAALSAHGNVRTTTLTAFTPKQFAEILQGLP